MTTTKPEPDEHDDDHDLVDPADQPVAGGTDDGPPAQGEGASDSY